LEEEEDMADYKAKDYGSLLGMEGFSDGLLNNHFTLYQGYVKNTNAVLEALAEMLKAGNVGTPGYAELKRRLGWEFNGMRLHEDYFESLGGGPSKGSKGVEAAGGLAKRLKEDFGSPGQWEKDFRAVGAMRGIGWAALYQDRATGRLLNFWINEHDVAHPSGGNLILIMDVFEHAFMLDYGLKKADYIEAFFNNINWEAAEKRLC
jgi:Fe-Mn family superoxide dismutase